MLLDVFIYCISPPSSQMCLCFSLSSVPHTSSINKHFGTMTVTVTTISSIMGKEHPKLPTFNWLQPTWCFPPSSVLVKSLKERWDSFVVFNQRKNLISTTTEIDISLINVDIDVLSLLLVNVNFLRPSLFTVWRRCCWWKDKYKHCHTKRTQDKSSHCR